MTLYHDLSDPPRTCWACVDDAVNAPDEPMPEHDPEVAGTDEDGPYCVCGHHLTEARTDTVVLTITWTETTPPDLRHATDEMLAALDAADITAHVTAQLQPEPDPLAWRCAAEDAEHWPEKPTVDAQPGDTVTCGACGWDTTRTADGWE